MDTISIEAFYGQSIGVKAPWRVVSVAIKAELKEVHVRLECDKGILWANPRSEQRIQIKGYEERTWRHLDTCEFTTVVSAAVPRVKYQGGRTEMIALPWAEPGGRFTNRFESHLIEFLQEAKTVKAASRLGRVTEDQMDGVLKRAVQRGIDRRKMSTLKKIGLDEKAYRQGHCYLTVLNDLDAKKVIDVVDTRTQEATESLLRTLPKSVRKGIEVVAMDMWAAYRGAVNVVLPEAQCR
jgi:transposase